MEEIQIALDIQEDKAIELKNRIDLLNDFANTPVANYYNMAILIDELKITKAIIKELAEIIDAIGNNLKSN